MYKNFRELETACAQGKSVVRVILEDEMHLTGCSEGEIYDKLDARYTIMEDAARRALQTPLHAVGGQIDGLSRTQHDYAKRGETLCGSFLNDVMARALSCSEVNASMGRICAAPTAGSCGILPAVLISLSETLDCPRRRTLDALLVASGFGAVVMRNGTVAGAEGGCQAECGVAAAMASAAAVYLREGSLAQMLSAFSHVLSNCMGLVCDPIAGLVQVPCAQRNASQAVNALLSADLALAGQVFPIPADEMVEAMVRVGRQLPGALKETAQGGIAATPAARAFEERLRGGKEE